MSTQRIAGLVAVTSGLMLVLALVVSAFTGPTAFANSGAGSYGPMGSGMMGADHMGTGMASGMMGFGTSGPASTTIPNATEIRVQAANFSFTPNEVRLPKSADVNLTFTNPAGTGVVHDFTVPGLGIHVVATRGETKTVGLRNLTAGRYDAYCGVAGHADLGMRATVIVD